MSLKLDRLEELITHCCDISQRSYIPIFVYPSEVLNCKVEIDRVRGKLSSDLYGQRTKETIQQLATKWDSSVVGSLRLPPGNLDPTELVIWILSAYGFSVSNLNERYTAEFKDRTLPLSIIPIQSVGVVYYLDRYEFKLSFEEYHSGYFRIPLRFYLACIHPAIHGSRPLLSLVDIPPEPLVEISTFLDLEALPLLFSTCTTIRSICDSESVWSSILANLSQYTSSQSSSSDSSSFPSKEKVHKIVNSTQKRRMMRFTQSVEVSDWASPFEYVSPTAALGRRRQHHRLDDFII
jgi:hypothetical protein